jgi:hypothetical protein
MRSEKLRITGDRRVVGKETGRTAAVGNETVPSLLWYII